MTVRGVASRKDPTRRRSEMETPIREALGKSESPDPEGALSRESEGENEITLARSSLAPEVQRRLEAIERVVLAKETGERGRVRRQVAKSLGISERSLRRLVKAWREEGISGLTRRERSDR
jgi:DNA-binding NtrC family response regulator